MVYLIYLDKMEFTSISPNLIRGKVDTMILKTLLEGDKYGQEIGDVIRDASGGTYVLKKPTLYGALKRLEDRGHISGYEQESFIGTRRKYYRLTDEGREHFLNNKDDWRFSKDVLDTVFYDDIERFRFKTHIYGGEEHIDLGNGSITGGSATHTTEENADNAPKTQLAADTAEIVSPSSSVDYKELFEAAKRHILENESRETDAKVSGSDINETAGDADGNKGGIKESATNTGPATGATGSGVQYITQYFIQGDYNTGNTTNTTNSGHGLPSRNQNAKVNATGTPLLGSAEGTHTDDGNENGTAIYGNYDMFDLPLSNSPQVAEKKLEPFVLNQEVKKIDEYIPFSSLVSAPTPPDSSMVEPLFAKYVSPNEFVVFNKVNPQPPPQPPITTEPEPRDIIEMRPFVRHWTDKPVGTFILYNKLKAVVATIVAIICGLGVVFTWLGLQNVYQQNEQIAFILAGSAIGMYLAVNLVIYGLYPKLKKLTGNYKREMIIRASITGSLLIVILGANIIMGVSGINLESHIVFFIVPAVLALGVIFEGLGIYALKRKQIFLG